MPYRLEVAPNNRRACVGPKPCNKSKITKGSPILGTWFVFQDKGSFKWRHMACMTPKVIKNLKEEFESASEVDGFEELPQEFQDKFTQYFDTETIPEEDLPESARVQPEEEHEGEDGEDGEEKKTPVSAKGKATKGKAKKEQDEQADTPKKPTSKGKKTVKKNDEEDDEPSTPKKKPASKRKAKKVDPDDEEEAEEAKPSKRAKTAKGKKPTSKGKKVEEEPTWSDSE